MSFATRLFAGIAVTSALAACWTLTGDVDGLSDGADATQPPTPNKGVDGATTSSSSGGSSSGGSSSGGSVDGSIATSDARLPDGASVTGFCATLAGTHTLCDDFDVGAFAARWTKIDQGAGGATSLVTTPTKSSPNAFRMALPSPCDNAFAQLARTNPGKPASAKAAFELDVVSAPPAVPVSLVDLSYLTATSNYRVTIAVGGKRLQVIENDIGGAGFSIKATSAVELAFGAWARIEAEIVFTAPAHVVVKVGGTTQIDTPIAPVEPTEDQSTYELGVYAFNNCDVPTEAFIDNAVFDYVPR